MRWIPKTVSYVFFPWLVKNILDRSGILNANFLIVVFTSASANFIIADTLALDFQFYKPIVYIAVQKYLDHITKNVRFK